VASKNVLKVNSGQNLIPGRTLLFFCTFIALYFNSEIADPFNSAKQFTLIISGAWLIGFFLASRKKTQLKYAFKINTVSGLVLLFLLFNLISFFQSDDKITALFGESQRKLGLVTYFCLSIIMLFAFKYITNKNLKQFYFFSNLTTFIFASYATLQYSGKDFIKWQNSYNVIIGTLGNPNFASAFMAMMACLSFSAIFLKSKAIYYRLFNFLIVFWLVSLIYLSDSKQGLVSVSLGVGIILGMQIYKYKRSISYLYYLIIGMLGIWSILGMLQIGPLKYWLYKDSVTLRGYYWRAGIEMFKANPVFGVGLDRYGANFNQYKDAEFAVSRGFELMSTNAHNIYIQLFATGGVFLGVTYTALNICIGFKAIKCLRKINSDNLVFLSGLFGSWLAYQAQAIVSIENIGTAVWGWVIGGSILGLTRNVDTDSVKINQSKFILQPIYSLGIVLLSLLFLVNLVKSETQTMKAQILFNSNNNNNIQELQIVSNSIIDNPVADPKYKLAASNFLLTIGDTSGGIESLQNLVARDNRNSQALSSLANYYESIGNYAKAIEYRLKISKFDPYNCKNYLKLGMYYKKQGDLINTASMLEKVLNIAPNSEVAVAAKQELKF